MIRALRLLLISCIVLSQSLNSQVLINEYSASNYSDYTDNYGEFEDWIEIYNPTGVPIDLNGYYLSDKLTNPTKWQFTASVMVPANGYRVVYCTQRDIITGNDAHTNFRLTQSKQEYIVLSDPGAVIVDSYWMEYPTKMNHSKGRTTDAAPTWSVFLNPTPGSSNIGGIDGYVDTPELDQPAGHYAGSVTVGISDADPTATIYYTLDGSSPDNSSTVYLGPLNIASTTVIRTIAYNGNPLEEPSFIETNTYFIDVSHTMPIVSIAGTQILTLLGGNQIEPVGSIEIFGVNGDLLDEAVGEYNEHGNDSWAYGQRGLDYITRDEFGYNDGINHEIFRTKDRGNYQRLILKPGANDNYPFSGDGAHIRDAYVMSLSQIGELRLDERSYEPCILFANGQYWGVYELREKVDDHDFTEYYYNQDKYNIDYIKTWGGTWAEYGSVADWNALVAFILGNDMTDQVNYDYVSSELNTGSLIDYFILNSYIVNSDWLNWNTSWWRGKNPNGDKKKWRYALWDMDATFGHYINYTGIPDQTLAADPCNPQVLNNPGGQGHIPIFNALLDNENFEQEYISRYADLTNSVFQCDFMVGHFDSLINILAPEMQGQVDRWGGTYAGWQANVQEMRDFMEGRCAIIADGIVDCYDVEGPFDLTVMIQPPGAGWVEFNSVDITTTPWNGTYFGGLNVSIEAHANGINTFSHWESFNHVLPDVYSDTNNFEFQTGDTIIAWFVTELFDITLQSSPPGSGFIEIGSTLYDLLPTTVELPADVNLDMSAIPANEFWSFDHWELNNHIVTPDEFTIDVILNLNSEDVITAHFNEIENYFLTLKVEPFGGGEILFDADVIQNIAQYQLLAQFDYSFIANPAPTYLFDGWEINDHILNPNNLSPDVSLTLMERDTLIAHFSEIENYTVTIIADPPTGGSIILNGQLLNENPHTQTFYEPNLLIELAALNNPYYLFSNWEMFHNSPLPDEKSFEIEINLMSDDTIIAHFVQEDFSLYIPNTFSPNGDGVNDVFFPLGYAVDVTEYQMEIYDRWGNLIFETTDFRNGWNGTGADESDYLSQNNVYVYRITYQSVFSPERQELIGHITVLR